MPRLPRTITRCDQAVDLRRSVAIVSIGKFRARSGFHVDHGRERYGISVVITDAEQPDVLGFDAKFALRLHVDLPDTAEAVKVVNEQSSHERLQRLVD